MKAGHCVLHLPLPSETLAPIALLFLTHCFIAPPNQMNGRLDENESFRCKAQGAKFKFVYRRICGQIARPVFQAIRLRSFCVAKV